MEIKVISSIRTLLEISNNNNNANNDDEFISKQKIEICEFLWDCSSISALAKVLHDNLILDVYFDLLRQFGISNSNQNKRLIELLIGLLANLATSYSKEILEKQLIGGTNILQLLVFSDDERILLELTRLFWTALFDEKSKEKWLDFCTKPIEIFKQFLFILENTLSPELFKMTSNLLQSIQSNLELQTIQQQDLSSISSLKANELCLETVIRLLLSFTQHTNITTLSSTTTTTTSSNEKFIRNEETIYGLLLLLDSILRSNSIATILNSSNLNTLIDSLSFYLIQFDVPDSISIIDLAILLEFEQQQQQQQHNSSHFLENKQTQFLISLLNAILTKAGIDFVEMHDEELFSAHWNVVSKLLKAIIRMKNNNNQQQQQFNQQVIEIVTKNFEIFTDAHQNESLVSLYPLPIEALKLLGISESKLNQLKRN